MNASVAKAHSAATWGGALPTVAGLRPACSVRLIDRRTGSALRINGSPLVIFTRRPDEAAAELLAGRDPAIWDTRIDPIETGGRP